MADQQLLELAKRLAAKTLANEALWNTTNTEDQFALRTGSGTILVDLYRAKSAYSLAIVSTTGVKVREIQASTGEPGFSELKATYDAAYRKYHRVDETLDDMLREVQKPGQIGESDDLPF